MHELYRKILNRSLLTEVESGNIRNDTDNILSKQLPSGHTVFLALCLTDHPLFEETLLALKECLAAEPPPFDALIQIQPTTEMPTARCSIGAVFEYPLALMGACLMTESKPVADIMSLHNMYFELKRQRDMNPGEDFTWHSEKVLSVVTEGLTSAMLGETTAVDCFTKIVGADPTQHDPNDFFNAHPPMIPRLKALSAHFEDEEESNELLNIIKRLLTLWLHGDTPTEDLVDDCISFVDRLAMSDQTLRLFKQLWTENKIPAQAMIRLLIGHSAGDTDCQDLFLCLIRRLKTSRDAIEAIQQIVKITDPAQVRDLFNIPVERERSDDITKTGIWLLAWAAEGRSKLVSFFQIDFNVLSDSDLIQSLTALPSSAAGAYENKSALWYLAAYSDTGAQLMVLLEYQGLLENTQVMNSLPTPPDPGSHLARLMAPPIQGGGGGSAPPPPEENSNVPPPRAGAPSCAYL